MPLPASWYGRRFAPAQNGFHGHVALVYGRKGEPTRGLGTVAHHLTVSRTHLIKEIRLIAPWRLELEHSPSSDTRHGKAPLKSEWREGRRGLEAVKARRLT